MRIEELKERLQNIGIAVSEKTLRRWGAEGFIHDHLPTTKLPGIGRGNIEEWPEESFEEAAAFHEVRYSGIIKARALSLEKVAEIKATAGRLLTSPAIFFELPSELTIITPPCLIFDVQTLELTLKDNELNSLAVAWIAAKEKARQTEKVSNQVRVTVDWYYNSPYEPPVYRSMLIPELHETAKIANQLSEMTRRVDRFLDSLASQHDDEKHARIRTNRDETRFTHSEPRLEPSQSNKDEFVVFLHSFQEFTEA